MRVWQPGSSLLNERDIKIQDWSWAQTKRRLTALYRLARPYRLRTAAPAVLLVGSRGGFRLDEAQQLGARSIVALEPEPVLHELIGRYRPDLQGDPRRLAIAPSAYLRGRPDARFDLIDIALDYQGSGDIGKYSFTVSSGYSGGCSGR